ncbi:ArsR/SmtB family transcription factor [Pseudaestuariivita sp.]|uniref:ArsR/SmtB family transcription factor n=1 Tax=Pseudaestuariivita sp. TaxID=2211669 RepID=UPI004057DA17
MDAIFKALNDPTRRALLDALRMRDGQTLTDLEANLEMTRFGVMKHLKLLEAAHLVTTKKQGRFKYHYLNAVPLQEVIDRWIEPLLAKPVARGMLDLKAHLETRDAPTSGGDASTQGDHMLDSTKKPDHVMQTFIRTTRDALWDALTDPGMMSQWHFMCPDVRLEDDTYHFALAGGTQIMRARTLTAEPKSRIEATFEILDDATSRPSVTVFLLDQEGPVMRLTVEHYDLTHPVVPGEGVHDGWARWAAGLKSWLETGETLRLPDPVPEPSDA